MALTDIIPPDLLHLVTNFLNYGMFAGGSMVKMPQVIAIVRTKTVKGISESSLAIETLACLCFCSYNFLMGHPFKTWGEMAMITLQCAIQVVLYWTLAADHLRVAPRAVAVVLVFVGIVALQKGCLPEALMPALGLAPTVLGSVSRLPQIIMNFNQKHTGNLSIITWGLSGVGNSVRIVTTLLTLSDPITLFGHAIAFILNFTLVFQILFYQSRTAEVVSKTKSESKQQ